MAAVSASVQVEAYLKSELDSLGVPEEKITEIINFVKNIYERSGGRRHTYAKKVPGRVTRSNRSRRRY